MIASSRHSICPRFNDCGTVVIEVLMVPAKVICSVLSNCCAVACFVCQDIE